MNSVSSVWMTHVTRVEDRDHDRINLFRIVKYGYYEPCARSGDWKQLSHFNIREDNLGVQSRISFLTPI